MFSVVPERIRIVKKGGIRKIAGSGSVQVCQVFLCSSGARGGGTEVKGFLRSTRGAGIRNTQPPKSTSLICESVYLSLDMILLFSTILSQSPATLVTLGSVLGHLLRLPVISPIPESFTACMTPSLWVEPVQGEPMKVWAMCEWFGDKRGGERNAWSWVRRMSEALRTQTASVPALYALLCVLSFIFWKMAALLLNRSWDVSKHTKGLRTTGERKAKHERSISPLVLSLAFCV